MASPETINAVALLPALGCGVAAYAVGCFATGYYLVRARTGQDIRNLGSGSIGARNVGRQLGADAFLITLGGDFAKGALAVLAARHFSPHDISTALAMIFVVVGHIWPINLQWRGGKGVATSLGALLVYDYQMALAYAGLFAVVWLVSRRFTLGGLLAYALLPVFCYVTHCPQPEVMTIAMLAALVCVAHRQNIWDEISPRWRRSLTAKPHSPKP